MSIYNIRPHHGLCVKFFIGKGYSEKFVKNMSQIISELKSKDPYIKIKLSADDICKCCPNNVKGACLNNEKVIFYDKAVLQFTNIKENDIIKYSVFDNVVETQLLDTEKMPCICKNCEWFEICARMAKKP